MFAVPNGLGRLDLQEADERRLLLERDHVEDSKTAGRRTARLDVLASLRLQ
jgi:hypothetical protein